MIGYHGQQMCFADSGTGCRAMANTSLSGCEFRKTTSQEQEQAIGVQRLKSPGPWDDAKAQYGIREGEGQ